MHKLLGTLAVALLCSAAFGGSALAADLLVDTPAAPEAAAANWGQFYFEVYGGLTLEGTASISYSSNPSYDADLDAGTAFENVSV